MAAITVRGIDEHTKERLRIQAARHGRSMEAEVRVLIEAGLEDGRARKNFLEALHESFAAVGGADLDIPPRSRALDREPPDFSGPEYDSLDSSA